MKSIVLLSLVALVSSANVKRQILVTQPILPLNMPIPIQTPMLTTNQMPIMNQQGSFLEQQNLPLDQENIKTENVPFVQDNFKSNINLDHNMQLTNEQLKMAMLHPNFNLAQLANLRANLPIMLPLPQQIQLQNPGLQIPNLFNPSVMNPINNLLPHSFSSIMLPNSQFNSQILPNNQFNSQILPMSQFSSPLIQGSQFSSLLLPKPAQRFFNILPTTLAPEVSLSGNILPQKGATLLSGIKGKVINKNNFTPKDAPIIQESVSM